MKTNNGKIITGFGLMLLMGVIVTGVNGCTSGPFSSQLDRSPPISQSSWRGDNHTEPVYTSPTETPPNDNLPSPPN
jgi:hypothetical protein